MKSGTPRDRAASVRQRLLNIAKERAEEFNFVLLRYGLERLLFRLGQSRYAGSFVLKGAMLFPLWSGSPHRATKDMDLLGSGPPDIERFVDIFREVAAADVADGVTFLPGTVAGASIREEAIYDGIRITLEGRLGVARIPLQVDVGFGNAVTPVPVETSCPVLFSDMARPRLRVYARETAIAEKVEVMAVGVNGHATGDLRLSLFEREAPQQFQGLIVLAPDQRGALSRRRCATLTRVQPKVRSHTSLRFMIANELAASFKPPGLSE